MSPTTGCGCDECQRRIATLEDRALTLEMEVRELQRFLPKPGP